MRKFAVAALLTATVLGSGYVAYEKLTQPTPEQLFEESLALNQSVMAQNKVAIEEWLKMEKEYRQKLKE